MIVNCDERKPFIFISYSHRDAEKVMVIVNRLYQEGYNVWYDGGIDPGTEWDENIAKHVQECSYFIAFISKNYLGSNNCKDELNYARDLDKEQLLIYLEEVELPGGMAMRLNRLQAILWDRFEQIGVNEAYAKLFSAQGIGKTKIYESAVQAEGGNPMDPTVTPHVLVSPHVNYSELKAKPENTIKQKIKKPIKTGLIIVGSIVGFIALLIIILIASIIIDLAKYSDLNDGEYSLHAEGDRCNYNKAIQCLEKSARKEQFEAKFLLGFIYAFEYDGTVMADYDLAKDYFEELEDNDMYAKLALSHMYYEGLGVEKDEEKAIQYIEEAIPNIDKTKIKYGQSDCCVPEALYLLGTAYNVPGTIYYDKSLAMDYYQKAIDEGCKIANKAFGDIYMNSDDEDDYIYAYGYYYDLSDAGNAVGKYLLAEMYYSGIGIDEDAEYAVSLYKEAVNGGSIDATFKLGVLYFYGENIEQDYDKAFTYIKKAAEYNNEEAYLYLALCYQGGYGVQQDDKLAEEWYDKFTKTELYKSLDFDNNVFEEIITEETLKEDIEEPKEPEKKPEEKEKGPGKDKDKNKK